jgi:hypothetical protein
MSLSTCPENSTGEEFIVIWGHIGFKPAGPSGVEHVRIVLRHEIGHVPHPRLRCEGIRAGYGALDNSRSPRSTPVALFLFERDHITQRCQQDNKQNTLP